MSRGFAVASRKHDGTLLVEVVESSSDEIGRCLRIADTAIAVCHFIASSLLATGEHELRRTVSSDVDKDPEIRAAQIDAIRAWIGDGFGSAYELSPLWDAAAAGKVTLDGLQVTHTADSVD
jgi:hypothetical protein